LYWLALCLRYLRSRRILFFSIAGVGLSVFAVITVLAVMNGFGQHLRSRIRGALSDLVVEGAGVKGFSDYEDIISGIEKIPGVAAVSPHLEGPAIFQRQSGPGYFADYVCRFVGIIPEKEAAVSRFREYTGGLVHLPSATEKRHAGAIVGSELLSAFGVLPGDEISLLAPTSFDDANTRIFTVVGEYRSGMYEYDSRLIFIPLEEAEKLCNLPGRATSLSIRLTDYSEADRIKRQIEQLLASRGSFDVSTWQEKREVFLRALAIEWYLTATIVFFFLVVSAFSIVAILTNIVLQKTSDIGVLRSLGASQRGILGAFLLYGTLVGLIGTLLGLLAATTFLHYMDPIERLVYTWIHWTPYPRDVYYIERIPREISGSTVVLIAVVAVLMSIAASIYPSWRAGRVDPVLAIRSLR